MMGSVQLVINILNSVALNHNQDELNKQPGCSSWPQRCQQQLRCESRWSFQDLVSEGFIGQSVLLPCNSSRSSAVAVFWRDKDDKVLLDIKNDKPDPGSRDPKFKGRVSSFPEEYQKGNFSIITEKLELGDDGNYECTIFIGTGPETI
ncbi:hypothetical protein XENOCAPTIV_017197 [Xenoophorus captivus]|uniref:Ig-like domain-containing protein n=1 Tax=Xenoophorus captivus TaxID=1517983 RepID=A0ABV0SGS6_9TELE